MSELPARFLFCDLVYFECARVTKQFFEDIEYGAPTLACIFHTDFGTGVFGKSVRRLPKVFGKRREAGLFTLGKCVGNGNADTVIASCFVDVKPTAVLRKILNNKNTS